MELSERKINLVKLNQYSQKLSQSLCARFFETQAPVNGEALLRFTPFLQVNRFLLLNLFEKWQSDTRQIRSPYFDYEAPAVQQALTRFMNVLSKHISIKRPDFEPLLLKACSDTLYLLISPYHFFRRYIETTFQEKLPVQQLREAVLGKYLTIHAEPYKVFTEALQEQNGLDDALALWDKVWSEQKYRMASGVAELLRFSQAEALETSDFFEPEDRIFEYQTSEEENILQQKENSSQKETKSLEAHTKKEKTNTLFTSEEEEEEEEEEEGLPEAPKYTYTYKDFEKTMPIGDRAFKLKEKDPSEEEYAGRPFTLNEAAKQDQKQTGTLLDRLNSSKISSLRTAITLNQKFLFINRLFKGNNQDFNTAIEFLDNAPDLRTALNYLKSQYADLNGWDMNSEAAMELTDMLARRFS